MECVRWASYNACNREFSSQMHVRCQIVPVSPHQQAAGLSVSAVGELESVASKRPGVTRVCVGSRNARRRRPCPLLVSGAREQGCLDAFHRLTFGT